MSEEKNILERIRAEIHRAVSDLEKAEDAHTRRALAGVCVDLWQVLSDATEGVTPRASSESSPTPKAVESSPQREQLQRMRG